MKHIILNDNLEIETIEGVLNFGTPDKCISDFTVKTYLFTDGNIINCREKSTITKECMIYDDIYKNWINSVNKTKFSFEDANYVIKVITAKEWAVVGDTHGWFEFIKRIDFF